MAQTRRAAALARALSSPIAPGASVGRVDQGVDYSQSSPYRAVGSGRIYAIDPNFYKGTPAVYEQLDQPINVNGRTYGQVYYSETPSLVKVGQQIAAGQPVTAAGGAELGFANGALPAAHNVYNEGDKTQAGYDFQSAISGVPARTAAVLPPGAASMGRTPATAPAAGVSAPPVAPVSPLAKAAAPAPARVPTSPLIQLALQLLRQ